MASLKLTVALSPDLSEMIDYLTQAIRRLNPHAHDTRVVCVFQETVDLLGDMMRPSLGENRGQIIDVVQGERVTLIPGDRFLRLVAKMRAVERALIS